MQAEAPQRGYAVVDLETTGLRPGEDHIIEIGVVLLDHTGQRESEWSTKVRQPIGRTVGAKEIHGLGWWSLRNGMPIRDALAQLSRLVTDRIVVAHNADFDTAFLRAESEQCGVALPLGQSLCTLQMSRTIANKPDELRRWRSQVRERYEPFEESAVRLSSEPFAESLSLNFLMDSPYSPLPPTSSPAPRTTKPSHKLSAVCERYGVPFTTSHRALEDARACANILPLLLRDFGIDHAEPLFAADSPLPERDSNRR